MLDAVTDELFHFAGPATSDMAWIAALNASVTACKMACGNLCHCILHFLSFLCESTLLRLPCVSLPCWDYFFLVCLIKTA